MGGSGLIGFLQEFLRVGSGRPPRTSGKRSGGARKGASDTRDGVIAAQ